MDYIEDEEKAAQKQRAEFVSTFRQAEMLVGCGQNQMASDETITALFGMIKKRYPRRGVQTFGKAMTEYASGILSTKPNLTNFVHPPLTYPLIAACLAEVGAKVAEKERAEKVLQENTFSVRTEHANMGSDYAQRLLNNMFERWESTPETDPIWFLWAEAFRIAYKVGIVFDSIPESECRKIAAEEQRKVLERFKTLSLTDSTIRDIVRNWNQELAAGQTPEGLKKAASIPTIKRIISEII